MSKRLAEWYDLAYDPMPFPHCHVGKRRVAWCARGACRYNIWTFERHPGYWLATL